jgi:phage recombination protein Bet
MNALVKAEPQKPLLQAMADRYQLEPEQFSKTVRATCGMPTATPEQFAAFLIVAKTYNLNPVLREIWAFPGRGGGIVPIVSVDGWINLVNSHGACDGFEFEMHDDASGNLHSCTCKMYRKDRKYPVTVTEYLEECKRSTEPWKMAHRMLRHKAMIQAARYAFGFAGIYDEDEARVIAESEPVRQVERARVPSPSEVEQIAPPIEEVTVDAEPENPPAVELKKGPPKSKLKWPDIRKNYEDVIKLIFKRINEHTDQGELETFLTTELQPIMEKLMPPDKADCIAAYDRRQARLKGDGDD